MDRAKTASLSDAYVDQSVRDGEFYDFDIRGIHKNDVRNMEIWKMWGFPRRMFIAFKLILNHLKLCDGILSASDWNDSYIYVGVGEISL